MEDELIASALMQWKELPKLTVLSGIEASKKYSNNTLACKRKINGALIPKEGCDLKKIVLIANKNKTSLYPFSCGHNWGYGGSTPVQDGCVILDLSQLNSIISFDSELGLITVEPGVTTGQLDAYLIKHQLPFMTPITGAGPHCSLMGNALEHGYGLNPYADHFASVMALEVILPDGSIYKKAFSFEEDETTFPVYKWGVGPYLDGLFSQGNFGIVTKMTIALAPKFNNISSVMLKIDSDQQLITLIPHLREVLQSVGGVLGPIKITNLHRVNAIKKLFPNADSNNFSIFSKKAERKLQQLEISDWLATFAIYSDAKVIQAVKSVIKHKLKAYVSNISFANSRELSYMKNMLRLIKPNKKINSWLTSIDQLEKLLNTFSGHPNEDALFVPYLKTNEIPKTELNPDRDNCGLIWFTPLVAMKEYDVKTYLETVRSVLLAHKIEFLVTMTSLSNYCFDSTIPIVFDKTKPNEIENANNCYRALFMACQEKGFIPYRLPIEYMDLVVDQAHPHWKLVKQIKSAIDKFNIIAPGRYEN